MHDWIVKKIEFEWRSAIVTIELEDLTFSTKTLIAEGVTELHIPRSNQWGPSVSVNEALPVEVFSDGERCLKIEMQSGDVIQIVATNFKIPGV